MGEEEMAGELLALARYCGSADVYRSAAWQQSLYRTLRGLVGAPAVGALAGLHRPRHPRVAAG